MRPSSRFKPVAKWHKAQCCPFLSLPLSVKAAKAGAVSSFPTNDGSDSTCAIRQSWHLQATRPPFCSQQKLGSFANGHPQSQRLRPHLPFCAEAAQHMLKLPGFSGSEGIEWQAKTARQTKALHMLPASAWPLCAFVSFAEVAFAKVISCI